MIRVLVDFAEVNHRFNGKTLILGQVVVFLTLFTDEGIIHVHLMLLAKRDVYFHTVDPHVYLLESVVRGTSFAGVFIHIGLAVQGICLFTVIVLNEVSRNARLALVLLSVVKAILNPFVGVDQLTLPSGIVQEPIGTAFQTSVFREVNLAGAFILLEK